MTHPKFPRFSPELAAQLDRLWQTLDDDQLQNDLMPPNVRRSLMSGDDCDTLPHAHGDFGRCPTNPIPVNGPIGEVLYLSHLRTVEGSPLMFHRLGTEDGTAAPVDVYEVLSLDRRHRETLFLSMYHPRKSRLVPDGYEYAPRIDPGTPVFGVNHSVPGFPAKLDAYIRKWQTAVLGVPLPLRHLRAALNGSPLVPSFLEADEVAPGSSSDCLDDALKSLTAAGERFKKSKAVVFGYDGVAREVDILIEDK